MSLDVSKVGSTTDCYELAYDWKTLGLYALGIGAKRDELPYLYEAHGPKVYPSFGVVPAYALLEPLIGLCGGNAAMMVHGGQVVRQFEELPPSGTLSTVGTLTGVYDMKKFAQVVFTTESSLDGKKIFETEWSVIFRDGGGFGGPRPPKRKIVKIPKDTDPTWSFEEFISPEQALVYRLSGDHNPLHADPKFAKEVGFERGPILHGLASYGYVCRAVAIKSCGGEANKIASLQSQFRNPIWPADTIVHDAYDVDGEILLKSYSREEPDTIVAISVATLR